MEPPPYTSTGYQLNVIGATMSTQDQQQHTSLWMTILLLAGSYTFGLFLHNIMHEFGHSATVWLQGGKVTGFSFHPFNGCLNFSTAVPNHIFLYAGGAFIGGAFTIIFPLLALKYKTPFIAPFVMACAAGLTTTACWMLISPFSTTFTDYTAMIKLGVPGVCLVLSGVLYLIIGIGTLILFLPLFGVGHDTGFFRRLAVTEGGILPFHLAAIVYRWLMRGEISLTSLAGLRIPAVFMALVAFLSWRLPIWFPAARRIQPQRIKLYHIVVIWAGVAILTVLMFLVSVRPDPG